MAKKSESNMQSEADVQSDANMQSEADVQSEALPIPEPLERDEFASSEFVDPDARLPRIQAVRGEVNLEHCGYLVTVDQMAQAGWQDFDESQLIEYTFNSGKTEPGILIRKPRMLVCPKTPVLAFERNESEKLQQTVILGLYDRTCKDKENIGNVQFFQVFLLNAENQPLHSIPLSYKAKGANQASFSQHWQQFCMEIAACHAIQNRIAAKPKNALFKSLCVFEFELERKIVGDKKKSPCCYVTSHTKPTLEVWKQHFLGYDEHAKEWTWEALEPERPLTVPAFPQLPPAPQLALPES